MKFTFLIDKNREEEVIVYAHKKTELIDSIEKLVTDSSLLLGYSDRVAVPLNYSQIYCFTAEDNKVFAITDNQRLQVKLRLYNLEEILPCEFIRINKSSIANISKIERFDASVSGTLQIKFKNGYIDYVSRRNLKRIKERLGL